MCGVVFGSLSRTSTTNNGELPPCLFAREFYASRKNRLLQRIGVPNPSLWLVDGWMVSRNLRRTRPRTRFAIWRTPGRPWIYKLAYCMGQARSWMQPFCLTLSSRRVVAPRTFKEVSQTERMVDRQSKWRLHMTWKHRAPPRVATGGLIIWRLFFNF